MVNETSEIWAEYNFDYGEEFEIALCKILRRFLPDKYGICRGFIVCSNNDSAGDDIIIYDRTNFTPLRFLEQSEFSVKEQIPVEAVYAYIECKHTITIDSDIEDGQSLTKAISQIAQVKKLERASPYPFDIPQRIGSPGKPNPIFAAVFARQVRGFKKGRILRNRAEITQEILRLTEGQLGLGQVNFPDLIVLGNDVVLQPLHKTATEDEWHHRSPFFIDGESILVNFPSPGSGFAVGLLSTITAIEWINLGRMPWYDLWVEAIDEGETLSECDPNFMSDSKKYLLERFGVDLDREYREFPEESLRLFWLRQRRAKRKASPRGQRRSFN